MRQLGPYIYRLCFGKETYRLRRRKQHQREYTAHALRHYEMLVSYVCCLTFLKPTLCLKLLWKPYVVQWIGTATLENELHISHNAL